MIAINGKVRALHGWRRSPPAPQGRKLYHLPNMALPPTSDLRALCPPVADQGQIGSCTANAGCEALEFLERKAGADPLFSRLFLYYYTRQLEGTPASADSGAEIHDVMIALARVGCCYEATWPYEPPENRFSLQPSAQAMTEASQHKALFYYACPDELTIKASLTQGYPVEIGFSVPDNMMSASCAATGVVQYPGRDEGFVGGHAVLIVGHDDSKQIGAYDGAFLFQNSWGEGWGADGFGMLPYRFFTENLASDGWTLRRANV